MKIKFKNYYKALLGSINPTSQVWVPLFIFHKIKTKLLFFHMSRS